MTGLTLNYMRSFVDILLDDGGHAIWSAGTIEFAIAMAVADLSRVLPRQQVLDVTVVYTVTAESITLVAGVKALANQWVKPESETITDSTAATTYTRDTDYTMDYANGVVTRIATGSIGVTDTILVTYKISRVVVDLTTITGFKRVLMCEYPVGNVPQTRIPFQLWGDSLFLGPAAGGSQERLTEYKHIYVYYQTEHTAPTTVAGTYAEYLDEVVMIGAQAYCLFIRAQGLRALASADLADANTALDFVATYNAAGASLAGILVTATGYLSTGASLINTVTVGDNVGALYRDYAAAGAELARQWGGMRDSYIEEGRNRLAMATQRFTLAERYATAARQKYTEFWTILKDTSQIREQAVLVSPQQSA